MVARAVSWMVVAGALLAARPTHAAEPQPPPNDQAPLLAATPGGQLTYSAADRVRIADVTRDGITGADLALRRSPGGLSGNVGTDPVDLRLEPNRIDGTVGDRQVGLDVVRKGGTLQVAGMFGDRSLVMEIRHDVIHAQVGPCAYTLPLVLGRYRGAVACGGTPIAVELSLPASLVARDDRELAAMLTAVLDRASAGGSSARL